ncbi:MAG: hypothetical protein ACREA0_12345, partial [bacterium]
LSGNASALLYNAMQSGGVPAFGEPHPTIPLLRCVSRSAQLQAGNDIAQITLVYKIPKPQQTNPNESGQGGAPAAGVVRVGSTVQSTTTQKDRFRTPISVTHTFPVSHEDAEFAGRKITQGVDVDVSVPQLVVSETRRESSTPIFKARSFVGTVNSGSIWSGAPRTYLCTRIDGQTNDNGLTYEVAYEFQYNPQTWDATVVFRDPVTQRPVDKPVDGQGIKTVTIYEERDFGQLGLSL